MPSTYNVQVNELHRRYDNGSKKPTRYIVRWKVDRERKERGFKLRTQADSFRSDLMAAARKGEAFDTNAGLPLSMLRSNEVDTSANSLARAAPVSRCRRVDSLPSTSLAR